MSLITQQRMPTCRNSLIRFSLLTVLAGLCMFATTAQGQTAVYSDSYLVDNSGFYYDAEEDAWVFSADEWAAPNVIGVGVTDADYDSYSESVETTFTGPSNSLTVTSYDTPSARVEISLTPSENDDEFDYTVQTRHRYYQDPFILASGPRCGRDKRCIQSAAYRGSPMLSFFDVVSAWVIKVQQSRSTYQLYHESWPFPYTAVVCKFNKVCGMCGTSKLYGQFLPWQSCPSYYGLVWTRTYMPWGGQFCVAIKGFPGQYLNCN